MGLFANLFRSMRKSQLIKSATARLHGGDAQGATDQIYAFISQDHVFIHVLDYFSASRDDIHSIIGSLMMSGAGQTFRGHFVPVSAVLFPDTLAYCLRIKAGQVGAVEGHFRIVEYFRKGEIVFTPEREFHS